MEKEKKVRQKINWKKEMKLAPGYIVIILWVIFTFMLLGWILAASLSTTTDIFAGKALKFPTGLHFENYIEQQLGKIDIPNKDVPFLREKLLLMYANPLTNYLSAL